MTDLARRRPAWFNTLVFALATAGLLVAATYVMFSAFMFYDDEGYVLLSLRNYAEHGGLYRDVYSQYGPFPFVVYHGLQGLGLPLTHIVGRLVTLAAWAGTALACAGLAAMATRSLLARLSVLAAVFLYLWIMANEPTHPGGLIVALTSLAAMAGYCWIVSGKIGRWAILIGATGAALLLTKVNIGLFFTFSAGAWWLLHHRDARIRRWAVIIVGGCAVTMPLGLMRPLLGTSWIQTFVFLFAGSGVATAAATATGATARVGWRELGQAVLAGSVAAGIVLASVMLRGTGFADLWQGLVLGPMRQPTNFSLRFLWPPGIHAFAAVSLVGCLAACWLKNRHRPIIDATVAGLRILCAAGLAANILRFPSVSPDYLILGAVLPCLWLFAWPLANEDTSASAGRAWVTLLLLGQSLHAFPVPGSQIAWGTVLTIPLAAMGAWEAARWLIRHDIIPTAISRRVVPLCATLVLAFTIATGWKFSQLAGRYSEGQNIGLSGAELVRIPDDSASLCRLLTYNASVHADMLFSLPGMFSFNLWAGLPTPTRANVTHWFSLLSDSQQRSIIQALEAHPRACVIVWRDHVNFLAARGLAPKGPLYDYIAHEFEPAFTIAEVEFCVRRGRKIEAFMVADILTRSNNAINADSENSLLRLTLLQPTAKPVSSIEINSSLQNGALLELNANNARVEFSPVDREGESSGPRKPATWPLQTPAAGTLWIYYDGESLPRPAREATIVLRADDNEEVELARLSAMTP